jgi:hypothetical protein
MSASGRTNPDTDVPEWTGPSRPYDIVKEAVIAFVVVAVLAAALAAVFSSPDVQPLTIGTWARADTKDFAATATSELARSSGIAQYGQPYNDTPGAAQKIGPVSLQTLFGVRIPIDTAKAFVLDPLSTQVSVDPALAQALGTWQGASGDQRTAWTDAYTKALDQATFPSGVPQVPQGDYGPVDTLIKALTVMARAGGLDGALLATKQFYQTDYTKPLLLMSDGSYLEGIAEKEHLLGEQWGMMNETGNYPGQAWLWLYTFWYQIAPFKSSGNADAEIWVIMMVLTLGLILVPFIPGVRSIPRQVRLYRLIWRDHYRSLEQR